MPLFKVLSELIGYCYAPFTCRTCRLVLHSSLSWQYFIV